MRSITKTLAAAATLALCAGARGSGPADRVVIVANSDSPDSVAIAQYYSEVRKVPMANVIELKMPMAETISWPEFVAKVWQPLEDELVRRGWIDAIAMDLFDQVGRRKYAVSGHRIAALVLCRGVPLRIMNDPALFRELSPLTDHPEFRTNQGAVDSELSLLAQTDYPINASVPNPLFGNAHPSDAERSQVVEVSRLDGPTAADALALVDHAAEAEQKGLLGRAYVDIAGPHESGDLWLERAAGVISDMGYDLSVSHGPATLPGSARFDAPALYFGWYTQDMNGPFALPGFRFPPGAIAVHIHSFSAHTLRSATEGWCGPLVARGVTATLGNVYEPYLEYLHRPDLFMEALGRGDDLVDAAYYALPVLSWQSIVIGDPLYRPFAVPLAGQTKDLSALPPQLAGYVVIRKMMALDAAGKPADAISAGKDGMHQFPNLALGLALAERLDDAGIKDQAVWWLAEAARSADTTAGDWGLIRDSAHFLAIHGGAAEATDLYRKLFLIDSIPVSVRTSWLEEARVAALDSGDTGQAAEWKDEMIRSIEKKSMGTAP
jgi:uncharacterized protein (TIGR03790 family)